MAAATIPVVVAAYDFSASSCVVATTVAPRLRNQREHVFTYLHHPEVEATNNLAERQLRPAVIARKLSGGNGTDRGARTLEVLTSLAATCRQRGVSFIAFIAPLRVAFVVRIRHFLPVLLQLVGGFFRGIASIVAAYEQHPAEQACCKGEG